MEERKAEKLVRWPAVALLFLPVGIWTLIVLLKPEVKELLSPGAGPA